MICDNNLLASGAISASGVVSGQTVTGTGNILSTNTIDLLQMRDVGEGQTLYLRSQVLTAVVGATSVEIQAITTDDAALTTNVTVVGSTGPIAVGSLLMGARFAAKLSGLIGSKGRRYLGVRYVITGTGTSGVFFTDFGLEIQGGQSFYPTGFAVA